MKAYVQNMSKKQMIKSVRTECEKIIESKFQINRGKKDNRERRMERKEEKTKN